MKKSISNYLTIILLGLILFYPNYYFTIPIAIIAISLNISELIKVKTELKNAVFYARTTTSHNVKIINLIPSLVLGILLLVDLQFKFFPKIDISYFSALLFTSVGLSFSLSAAIYQNFTNSVRSFESGIELPYYIKNIVKWKDINSLEITNDVLKIDISNKGSYSFTLDTRDFEDAKNIIEQFSPNKPIH